jgi:Ca2+-binding RTX toxin-like protein
VAGIAAIRVDHDLAAGQASIGDWPADDESARRVDVGTEPAFTQLRRNHCIDDVLGGDGNDLLGAGVLDSFDIRFFPGQQPWWAGAGLLWKDEFDGGSGINGVALSGTDGNDNILIHREPGELHFILNGVDQVLELANCQTIIVHAGKGDDTVVMDASGGERWKAEFYGEDGNDHLVGSAMDDLLDGGKGNDTLEGGPGHDTMIGDQGNDLLISDGNDVLFKNKRKDSGKR